MKLPSCTVHSDRNKEELGKSRGVGLCVYVHDDLCRDSITAYKSCSPDLETVSVKYSCITVVLITQCEC